VKRLLASAVAFSFTSAAICADKPATAPIFDPQRLAQEGRTLTSGAETS
jgi:hypothetical protein